MIDNKEYARQLRKNAVKDENGVIKVSPELWEQIATIIENIDSLTFNISTPNADVGCYDEDGFLTIPMKDALDLINRHKAEIERLNTELEIKSQKRANIFEIVDAFERGRTDGIKEFAEKLKEYFPSIAKAIDHAVEELKGE